VLTLVTALLVGLVPALRATRRDVQSNLHSVNSTASASHSRTREALVVAQMALTLVFLVGAGLFLRTVYALHQVPLGFSQRNVLTGGIILNPSFRSSEKDLASQPNIVQTHYLPLLEKLRAIPGVRVAALSSVLPMRSEFQVTLSATLDHKELPPDQALHADGRLASAGLVQAMGIPMLRGRFFRDDDSATSPVVVVVNQAFVDRYLKGLDPIGHTISMGKGRFAEEHIVGVIGDVKQTKVTQATTPEMYFCLAQTQPGTPLYGIATAFIQVAIRGSVPADSLRVQFDKALHEIAPDATTTNVKTVRQPDFNGVSSGRLRGSRSVDRFRGTLRIAVLCCRATHAGVWAAHRVGRTAKQHSKSCSETGFTAGERRTGSWNCDGMVRRFTGSQLHLWSQGARWSDLCRSDFCLGGGFDSRGLDACASRCFD